MIKISGSYQPSAGVSCARLLWSMVQGDVVQSIQITFHHSSFPIAIADVLKRNLIILKYVPPVLKIFLPLMPCNTTAVLTCLIDPSPVMLSANCGMGKPLHPSAGVAILSPGLG